MLADLVRRRATDDPDGIAVVGDNAKLTNRDLFDRGAAIGRGLGSTVGSRFACSFEDVGELLVCLVAASISGAEPCIHPSDASPDEVRSLARRFDHDVVISDRTALFGHGLGRPMPAGEFGDDSPPASPDARILVLTSGTTGEPKGAVHLWARLIGAVHGAPDPASRWLLAYNPHQFAGLQVLVHALASDGTIVVPGGTGPRAAVDAMTRHGVTHVSATPTFWRFVLNSIPRAELRELGLTRVTLGGEAASDRLLDDLAMTFESAAIRHVYAATELGSLVSVADGRAGLPVALLDRVDRPERFRIVDGELQVRSSVGMVGYHGDDAPAATQWRPTGDLVEVRGDRIQFVGRTSDTINVGGVKVHPLPIEDVVDQVRGVDAARVYGHANAVAGQIVAVDVVLAPGADEQEVEGRIRSACAELARPAQPRRIRFVDRLEVRADKVVRGVSES